MVKAAILVRRVGEVADCRAYPNKRQDRASGYRRRPEIHTSH